ncbi:MAG: rhamnogalacturonan acetylesterase [Polyangiales bacterium]
MRLTSRAPRAPDPRPLLPFSWLLSALFACNLVVGCAVDPEADAWDETPDALPQEATATTCTRGGAAVADTPRVFVVGDSTASSYAANLAPRTGWAQALPSFFTPACASVQNRALSGRSSKSFWDEGAFDAVKSALRKGDYLLIQFGHNDEKDEDRARFTSPFSTYQTYLSRYIDEARAKGATPLLLTPIQRNKWSGGKLADTHGSYPDAMRQLAAKRGIALVDASALTKAYFERIGQAATTKLFMNLAPRESPNYPGGNQDDTHLQERGARAVAQLVLADLARQQLPLGSLVKAVVKAP